MLCLRVSSHVAKLCVFVCNHYSCNIVLVRVHAVLACEQPRSKVVCGCVSSYAKVHVYTRDFDCLCRP